MTRTNRLATWMLLCLLTTAAYPSDSREARRRPGEATDGKWVAQRVKNQPPAKVRRPLRPTPLGQKQSQETGTVSRMSEAERQRIRSRARDPRVRHLAERFVELTRQIESEARRTGRPSTSTAERLHVAAMDLLNAVHADRWYLSIERVFTTVRDLNAKGDYDEAAGVQQAMMITRLGFTRKEMSLYRSSLALEIRKRGLAGLEGLTLNAIDYELLNNEHEVLDAARAAYAKAPESVMEAAPLIVHDIATRWFLAFEGSLFHGVFDRLMDLATERPGAGGRGLMAALGAAACDETAMTLAGSGDLPGVANPNDLAAEVDNFAGSTAPGGLGSYGPGGAGASPVDELISAVCGGTGAPRGRGGLGGGGAFANLLTGACVIGPDLRISVLSEGDRTCATVVAEQFMVAAQLARFTGESFTTLLFGTPGGGPSDRRSWIADGESDEPAAEVDDPDTANESESDSTVGRILDAAVENPTDTIGAATGVAEIVLEVFGAFGAASATAAAGAIAAVAAIPVGLMVMADQITNAEEVQRQREWGLIDARAGRAPSNPLDPNYMSGYDPNGKWNRQWRKWNPTDPYSKKVGGVQCPVPDGSNGYTDNPNLNQECINERFQQEMELARSIDGDIDPMPDAAPRGEDPCNDGWHSSRRPLPDPPDDVHVTVGVYAMPTQMDFERWFREQVCLRGYSTDDGFCAGQPTLGAGDPPNPPVPTSRTPLKRPLRRR